MPTTKKKATKLAVNQVWKARGDGGRFIRIEAIEGRKVRVAVRLSEIGRFSSMPETMKRADIKAPRYSLWREAG